MTVAPLALAALIFRAQSEIDNATCAVHGFKGASGSIKISSARVRLARSDRGRTLSWERSSGCTLNLSTLGIQYDHPSLALAAQHEIDERDGVAEVGDHGVGTYTQQPRAFPLVDLTRAVVGFVRGDGNCQAADLFGV